MTHDPFPPGSFAGVIATRTLADGRRLDVTPLTFGRAKLHLAAPGNFTDYLDEW